MALQDKDIILRGIQRFPAELQERVHWLRELVWDRYPESTELVYIKANAVAAGWALSDSSKDIFVSYAVYSKHINLGFNFGMKSPTLQACCKGRENITVSCALARWNPYR